MVISRPFQRHRQAGALLVELLVAMALLTAALLPIAYSVISEKRFARAAYHHSVAMEIVDGELEALAAGEWRAFAPGTQAYAVRSAAATNLPPGRFMLTLRTNQVRLEWHPTANAQGAPTVVREAMIR
jgi:Tfp pilus assembly protein PilX